MAVLSSCDQHQHDPVRIGATLWPGYEPLHLAMSQGYLSDSDVTLVDSISPHGSIQGIRNGNLEAVALTLDEVLLLIDQGIPLKVVLIMDYSNGGDAILSSESITSVTQLEGKKVGLESGALGSYILSRALEKSGLSIQDVETHYIKVSGHQQALESQKVDAVVTFDPERSKIIAAGANEIFSTRQLPSEIVDVLAFHQDVLMERPEVAQKVIDAWFKALNYFNSQPVSASRIMSQRLKQSPDEVLQSFRGIELPDRASVIQQMTPGGLRVAPLVETTNRLIMTMNSLGMLHSHPDANSILESRFLRQQ